MKAWIANLLWDALAIFLGRVHDWVFSPQRAVAIRFKNREIWWAYTQKAAKTANTRDDMRANWYAFVFDFETPPAEALRRGDLSEASKKAFADAWERHVNDVPTDRAKP